MEGINKPESFEGVKNRITDIFNREGLSESLNSDIEKWHSRRQQETDMPSGTIEQRVVFQVELARIYIAVGKNDSASDTLSDAWDEANQEGLTDLVREITELMNYINPL